MLKPRDMEKGSICTDSPSRQGRAMTGVDPKVARQMAEGRGRLYGFLASMYLHVPDSRLVSSLLSEEFSGVIESMSKDRQISRYASDSVRMLREYVKEAHGIQNEKLAESLAVDWTRLFRGVKPGYGPLPPYELVYGRTAEETQDVLIDLARTYDRFGAAIYDKSGNGRPDYIGIELDFMRFMAEKEANGWNTPASRALSDITDGERKFLEDHVTRWVPRFSETALSEARTKYIQGIIGLTRDFLRLESENVRGYLDATK